MLITMFDFQIRPSFMRNIGKYFSIGFNNLNNVGALFPMIHIGIDTKYELKCFHLIVQYCQIF